MIIKRVLLQVNMNIVKFELSLLIRPISRGTISEVISDSLLLTSSWEWFTLSAQGHFDLFEWWSSCIHLFFLISNNMELQRRTNSKIESEKYKEGTSCFPGMWKGLMLWEFPLTPYTC